MQALIAVVAILAGILLGFWIRTISAKRELALLEQRNREVTRGACTRSQKQLAQAQCRVRRPRRL